MFYMLANVHHQITSGEVLPPSDHFWYYLPDLPFRIQNAATSFQLEPKHLISRETPQSIILSGLAGTDVPSLCTFLEVLSGNGPEYDSDDIDYDTLLHMCYHVNDDDLAKEVPGLMWPTFRRRRTTCALYRWTWRPPRESSSTKGKTLHGSELRTLSAMTMMPAWGLPAASASPVWRTTWRPPLAT
jgi:hypothetical protein